MAEGRARVEDLLAPFWRTPVSASRRSPRQSSAPATPAVSECTAASSGAPPLVTDGEPPVETDGAPPVETGGEPPLVSSWEPPVVGADSRFRARARMAVSGTAMDPVLGLPGESAGADLSDCPLHPEGVEEVLTAVKALIRRAQVPPYDVARRRGELKNVIVTHASTGAMMLQLVLRTDGALPRLREHLPALLEAQPDVVSVFANIHPEHTALLTGAEDIHLAGSSSLPMPTGDVTLHAHPGSFVQTNTEAAGELYRTAARWALDALCAPTLTSAAAVEQAQGDTESATIRPRRLWDLYCGLGGFALHIARAATVPLDITGVEIGRAHV